MPVRLPAPVPTTAQAAESLVGRLVTWATDRPDEPAYTFVDYLVEPGGRPQTLTWAQLDRRVRTLAGRLRQMTAPGDRVAVLAPSGLDYVVALYAAWYAGAVAVPLFAPGLPGHAERLVAAYDDCAPRCVLTVADAAAAVRDFVADRAQPAEVLVVDAAGDPAEPPADEPVSFALDEVAYLQYTSGSTRTPAGVEITHRNLTANVAQLWSALTGGRERITGVNWLPLFHDMGLLSTVALPLWKGTDSVFLDPVAFLMQPARWLRLLSGRDAAFTAAPNFAYELCLRRWRQEDLDGLDLSGVFLWLNGAEPVRADTLHRFATALRDTGVDERALCAAYGLAEATVFVSGQSPELPPAVWRVDRDRLAAGEAVPPDGDAVASELVSCGPPAGQRVAIVDPATGAVLPPGRVGEVWVHGPNVARRYWRQPERSDAVFAARLDPAPDGLPAGPWLRTGDLGTRHDGELFITGRLKDLLIVAGRNHYPQDIEVTVAQAAPAMRAGRIAVFAVTISGEERAVVVGERSRSAPAGEPDGMAQRIRQAVWRGHDLALHDVLLTEPGAVPHTSSGKISRSACREQYLAGAFTAEQGERR